MPAPLIGAGVLAGIWAAFGNMIEYFARLPSWMQYIVVLGALLGLSIDFAGYSLGDLIFWPFSMALGAMGIYITWDLFVVLVFVSVLVLFALTLNGGN